MEPKSSILHSQMPATCPNSELAKDQSKSEALRNVS
jgi:hypothetical protein